MIAILPFSPPNFKIRGSMIDKINKIVGNKEPAVKKISLKLPVFVIPIATKLITVPNNKNIILAAEQANDLTEKSIYRESLYISYL